MSILVYDGLRELIKREFTDRNMATTDNTVNAAVSLITTVMEDYRSKSLQLVGTALPSTGVAGTIYLQSKSEPNEKNRFIAYVFENGKFVQVGSSFFPEDFEHDSELNVNSHITVENKAIKTAIDSKYDLSKVINNVVYNDANSVHADDTPTSSAIQAELDAKLGYEDGSPISKEQLWQIFRPELNRLVYPKILLTCKSTSSGAKFYRLEGKDMLTGLRYKSGFESMLNRDLNYLKSYCTGIFTDLSSDRSVRIDFKINAPNAYSFYTYPDLYDSYKYPSEYLIQTNWKYADINMGFVFLDPVPVGILDNLIINFKAESANQPLKITTELSDTGKGNSYTTIQNNVIYDNTYTEGIPFYGFN